MYYKGKGKRGNSIGLDRKDSFSEDEIRFFEDILRYVKQKKDRKDVIPISIFNNKLAPLETVVKYLREELDYSYKEIGVLLNRKAGPIGVSYRTARRKFASKLNVSSTENSIPISIFKDSRLSIFESIVVYLKDDLKLKFRRIAELLTRNYRTVWTVYRRAKEKNEG